jgi:hypothetical protein
VYLKGGVTETDLATYPDATAAYANVSNWGMTSGNINPQGIAWDGTHFYVADENTNIYKYNSSGTHVTTYSVYNPARQTRGIVWDGTHFWILSYENQAVYKFNSSFVYQNVSFSTYSQSEDNNMSGLTWDGTNFWTIGRQNDKAYKYNSSGVYQNVNFSIANQDTLPNGITWDGTYFWVTGSGDVPAVYKYSASGVYQNELFYTGSQDVTPKGVVSVGSDLWVPGSQNDSAYKYSPQIGVVSETGTPLTEGKQNYVRIK